MAKSISVKRKTRGRPATGTEPLYGVRISDALMTEIMQWAKSHDASRSEAIRRLVEIALRSESRQARSIVELGPEAEGTRPTGRRPSAALVADLATEAIDSLPPKPIAKPGRRLRAKELARDAIEKMGDPTASPEERDQRRRRLTKGPTEFREARVDQPKAKGK
jgi:hypothetical protein